VASKVLLEEEKNSRGHPLIVLTDEQKKMVEQMARISTVQQIADYLGIHRSSFFHLVERDEELNRLYKKGRAEGHCFVAGNLMKKIKDGDTTAMIFYLKTQSRWKEAKEEIEQVKIETPEEKAERLKEGRLYMEWRSKHLKQEDISK